MEHFQTNCLLYKCTLLLHILGDKPECCQTESGWILTVLFGKRYCLLTANVGYVEKKILWKNMKTE